MFLIRQAKVEDVPTLLKLARMVHFINLPADREIITEKVSWSRQCFLLAADAEPGLIGRTGRTPRAPGTLKPPQRPPAIADVPVPGREYGVLAAGIRSITGQSPLFMFIMEELEGGGGVIGTSQIISRMGGPGHPNVSLQLARKEMFSQSLQMGVTHTVARLHLDETGPTEIGGLILQPSYRGHKLKLGRLIGIVRFHFMALHPHLFSERVLAEMMGPISIDGENPFWEHCTRHFINMTYDQADRFCQQSKEFILSLFPREDIYLTLLAPEARSVVGQVGPETLPARRMLEKLGFKYHHRVDPFDGGPHLEAHRHEIAPMAATARRRGGVADEAALASAPWGLVSSLDADGEFRAVYAPARLDESGAVLVSEGVLHQLSVKPGASLGFTPAWSIEGRVADAHEHALPASAGGPAPTHVPAAAGANGTHAPRPARASRGVSPRRRPKGEQA